MFGLSLTIPTIGTIGSTTGMISVSWENQWCANWEDQTQEWQEAYGSQCNDIWIKQSSAWESVTDNWETLTS